MNAVHKETDIFSFWLVCLKFTETKLLTDQARCFGDFIRKHDYLPRDLMILLLLLISLKAVGIYIFIFKKHGR